MPNLGTNARRLSLRAHLGPDKHADALPILYFALLVGDPFGAGVEPSSTGGYARAAINNDATLWGTIAAGQTNAVTLVDIAFPVATALYSTGLTALNYWAVYDNAAGGNLWYGGPMVNTITVTGAGDQPRLPAGGLNFVQGA